MSGFGPADASIEGPVPRACDLLIEAGWVVPIEPHGVVWTDHAVAVTAGTIVAVLPREQARREFAPDGVGG